MAVPKSRSDKPFEIEMLSYRIVVYYNGMVKYHITASEIENCIVLLPRLRNCFVRKRFTMLLNTQFPSRYSKRWQVFISRWPVKHCYTHRNMLFDPYTRHTITHNTHTHCLCLDHPAFPLELHHLKHFRIAWRMSSASSHTSTQNGEAIFLFRKHSRTRWHATTGYDT